MEKVINFITSIKTTELLGILGFIISLINIIYFLVVRRKKVTVNFGDYGIRSLRKNSDLLLIHYRFDNNSQLSIAITRVRILISGKEFDCDRGVHIAEKFKNEENHKEVYSKITTTDILPINLAPLASQSGFLGFVIPQDILLNGEKSLTFRIYTNRGKVIQKTFALYEDVKCR